MKTRRAPRVGVLAFDPGGTTGWAYVSVDRPWLGSGAAWGDSAVTNEFGQLVGPEPVQADDMIELVAEFVVGNQKNVLVSERFTLRSNVRTRELLAPVRLNACLEWWCYRQEVELAWQDPALAMSRWTDDRVKDAGLYDARMKKHGGGPHALDATRHALTFLTRISADAQLRSAVGWS